MNGNIMIETVTALTGDRPRCIGCAPVGRVLGQKP